MAFDAGVHVERHVEVGAFQDLAVVAVVAVAGVTIARGPVRGTLVAWLITGVLAVNIGGSYWSHYYVQLLPPLAFLSAVAAASVSSSARIASASGSSISPRLPPTSASRVSGSAASDG